MATFNEKYIYSVQVNGAAKSIAQLEQLISLSNQLKAQNLGGAGGANVVPDTPVNKPKEDGARAGKSWGDSFNASVKHAVINTAVYGSIAAAMGVVVGSAHAWTQANIALSDSLAQLQVNLGGTRKAAEDYYWQMQQAAFATGQDVSESVYAKTIEKRINRPGLAQGGMEFGLVFPEVPVQDAVGNLLALQIQFGSSFKEINEVLLDTVQASGLTAKELLNLSDTWGPLSQELGMLDAAGNRTTEGMRNISGLMAGMATVMGESGSTIENFLRKMSQFYTNADLKAFLELRGISTTSGKTETGLDIRVPFMELMAQISAQAKKESGFTVGLQGFFPNQLGQPTQQQLQELIRNWDTISGIMAAADDPVREWGEAVEISSERASVAIKRIGDATSGLFAAIGGNETFTSFLNTLAAGIQNQAVRAAGAKQGYAMQGAYDSQAGGIGSDLLVAYSKRFNSLERFVQEAAGDSWRKLNPNTDPSKGIPEASYRLSIAGGFLGATEQRVKEMLLNLQVPDEFKGRKSEASNYAEAAIRSFVGSEYFDPKENGALMAQSFLEFLANGWNEQLATNMALAGGGVGAISQSGAATYSTGPLNYTMMPPPRTNIPEAIDTLVESYEVIGSASWLASRQITAMADAAGKEYTIMGSKGVTLPEGVTFAEGMKEYTRRMVELADFASTSGVKAGLEITPTTVWGADGSPFTVINVEADVLADVLRDLGSAASGAAGELSVLGGVRLAVPSGASYTDVIGEYFRLQDKSREFAEDKGILYEPKGYKPTGIIVTDDKGNPLTSFTGDKGLLGQAISNVQDVQTELEKTRNENRALANQANSQAEARAKRLEGFFDSMLSAITSPTSVTATDLMYNAPGGKYQNKWDEPVRQMRADVNNLIAGKPNEYGFGGGMFGNIFTPDILGFAQGADQDTKAAIMKDLQAQAEKAYYSFTLPSSAYTGSKDALIASAQDWVAGKKSEKANKAMMKGWLTDAGLGPEAMGFLDEMDEPPILKMLTGGKTKEEMTTLFGDKIPNVSDTLAKGASDVAWIAIIGTAITAQTKDNPDPLIGAGQAMGGWLAQGSASTFVATLVPQIIAAVLAGL